MDQKKSWWTLLRESSVDPPPGEPPSSSLCLRGSQQYVEYILKREKGNQGVFFWQCPALRKATLTVFKEVSRINVALFVLSWSCCTPRQVLFNNVQQCNCYKSHLSQEVLLTAQVSELSEASLVCYLQVSLSPPQCRRAPTEHTPTYLLPITYFTLTCLLIGKGGSTDVSLVAQI